MGEGRVTAVTETAGCEAPAPPTEVRRISVLGATGSIGRSTLDLVARAGRGRFEVVALTAHGNAAQLAELAITHGARLAAIGDQRLHGELAEALSGTGIRVASGPEGLVEAAMEPADCVMAAIVGAASLEPTLAAVRQGRRVAFASKECLVCAGEIVMREVERCGTELLPVDSEHSAVFQIIAGMDHTNIEQIALTASGGPFRDWTAGRLAAATPEEALKHPNWSMGAKISIDSATLMNKGLEIIEAYHLFPVEPDQLAVVVHPQSIVHCLVSCTDGSVLAQMSAPDMRMPIALSLSWPRRMPGPAARLDLARLGSLTFESPDEARFPALRLAREALARGGGAPLVLNAANEVAVAAFLERRIGFLQIAAIVEDSLAHAGKIGLDSPIESVQEVIRADREARLLAGSFVRSYV